MVTQPKNVGPEYWVLLLLFSFTSRMFVKCRSGVQA